MNKRITELEAGINSLKVIQIEDATQGDKSTHFIDITFKEDIELTDWTLIIYFKTPYPVQVYVDKYNKLSKEMRVIIPSAALNRNGKLRIEFALKKDEELITINKSLEVNILSTINGTYTDANIGDSINGTITEKLEEIDNKIENFNNIVDVQTEGFNNNAKDKTTEFNNNAVNKTTDFDNNSELKTTEFNNNFNDKTKVFNENSTVKTTKFDENVSVKTTEFNNHVENKKTELNNYVESTNKVALDEYEKIKEKELDIYTQRKGEEIDVVTDNTIKKVNSQGNTEVEKLVEVNNKIILADKTELDNYVETASKPHIDKYVAEKEQEIKGATYMPNISPDGDLSWVNDKNLPNPTPVNIKGPQGLKGDPGNFIFKIEDGHLILYTVENENPPKFTIDENGHLIMEII